jgi:hypothetical protein
MKNSQKGSVVSLLVIIIILLVAGGGIYMYLQNKKTQTAPVFGQNNTNVSVAATTTPVILSLSSNQGTAGQIITINGNNLSMSDFVVLAYQASTVIKPTSASADGTQLQFTIPNGIAIPSTSIGGTVYRLEVVYAPGFTGPDYSISGPTSNQVSFTVNPSSATQNETTIVIKSINGSFIGNNILNIKDNTGKQWSVNYQNAKLYYTNPQANPSTWSGNISDWLTSSKASLAPGVLEGNEGQITIVGSVDANGVLNASSITQYAQ